MKKTIICACCALLAGLSLLSSCSKGKYHVEGAITNAKDSTLYFENLSLEGPVVLDSVKLTDDGKFSFAADAQEAPEFYRLRIADQIINVCSDSTETVTVNAKYPDMAWNYEVSGSDNCKKIQELAYMQIGLQNQIITIARNPNLGAEASQDSISKIVNAYKEKIKADYIIKEPMKAYAYFALFQAVGPQLIFNPRENADDIKMFAAVATSWDTFYPNAERGLNLHNIALEGMKTMRIVRGQQKGLVVEKEKIHNTNMLDLSLLDNNGNTRKLSELKGNVVLLDFHAFSSEKSTERIMWLRDLYNKYHAQGFEIYQVGLDDNEHFWKTSVAALPWVSVYDTNGSASSTYNVQTVPTFFLLDRNCTPAKRDVQIKDIDAEIKALL